MAIENNAISVIRTIFFLSGTGLFGLARMYCNYKPMFYSTYEIAGSNGENRVILCYVSVHTGLFIPQNCIYLLVRRNNGMCEV